MRYAHFDNLPPLIEQKMITRRPHPGLPLDIYNYTVHAQFTPIADWSEAMKDCRGLILDRDGEIVGRPFRKFWNYDQVRDQIPNEPFFVWEKLDGSLGIVCSYAGERVVATRGSFESDQAKWLAAWLDRKAPNFYPSGETWLFEILYPENRIVVDYGDRQEAVLLSVMSPDGHDLWSQFNASSRFRKAGRYEIQAFDTVNSDPQFSGSEGFVVQWESGFRAKVKLEEYKRLHRLITQCSTRTIWELMRAGEDTQELLDRVPEEFAEWVLNQIDGLNGAVSEIREIIDIDYANCEAAHIDRKEFAEYAKTRRYPGLLFRMLDGKPLDDMMWKLVEPKWATPFRKEVE